MNYKFSFVILHYKNIEETRECIESVLNNVIYKEVNIVIVDNGSNDGTGEELKRIYGTKENVFVLINNENLGFAKGNNIGYKFSKEILNTDFIVMINSDVLIEQNDFCDVITKIYEKKNFALLGPDALSEDKSYHQNPLIPREEFNSRTITQKIKYYKRQLVLAKLYIEPFWGQIKKYFNLLFEDKSQKKLYMMERENVLLFGCCFIFSPQFIRKKDGLFDKTFMYGEEEILYYICRRDNLKILYSPEIKIIHKGAKSTGYIYKNIFKKHIFFFSNYIDSLNVFLELIKTDEKK